HGAERGKSPYGHGARPLPDRAAVGRVRLDRPRHRAPLTEGTSMPIAERSAQTTWTGSLTAGEGTLTGGSGALGELPVTWASRTERSDGKTSPEELIAAAHAACFSMALSHELTQGGNAPEQLDVAAVVTLDRVNGAPTVTR